MVNIIFLWINDEWTGLREHLRMTVLETRLRQTPETLTLACPSKRNNLIFIQYFYWTKPVEGNLTRGCLWKLVDGYSHWMMFPWGYDYLWSSELQHGVDIFRCICHRPWFKPTQHLAPRSPKQASLKPREATYYRDTIWCVFDAKYWGIQLRSSNIDH